jgi:hypothetical protein
VCVWLKDINKDKQWLKKKQSKGAQMLKEAGITEIMYADPRKINELLNNISTSDDTEGLDEKS